MRVRSSSFTGTNQGVTAKHGRAVALVVYSCESKIRRQIPEGKTERVENMSLGCGRLGKDDKGTDVFHCKSSF